MGTCAGWGRSGGVSEACGSRPDPRDGWRWQQGGDQTLAGEKGEQMRDSGRRCWGAVAWAALGEGTEM